MAEVALRAHHLIRVFEVIRMLDPQIIKAIPGVVDRLARDGPEAWTEVFIETHSGVLSLKLRKLKVDLHPLAVQALRGAGPGELAEVIRVIGQKRYRQAVPELLALLKSGEPGASLAARALGKFGVTEAIPFLPPLLRDEDKNVRENALYALKRLDSRQCRK